MGIVKRAGTLGLVLGLVAVAGLAPAASAMVPTDPWVPPSVATSDGLASSTMDIGGASVPVVAGDPADVTVKLPQVSTDQCGRHWTTWGWSGLSVTVNYSEWGLYPTWCSGAISTTQLSFGCVMIVAGLDNQGNQRPAGYVFERDYSFATSVWGTSPLSVTVSAMNCTGNAVVLYLKFPERVQSAGVQEDGLMTWRPGAVRLVGVVITATTHCSDNSTVAGTFAPGVSIVAAACATGTRTGVVLTTANGAVLGTTTVYPAWVGNPCLAAAGSCALRATSSGGSCLNTDPACTWWGGTDSATECAWQSNGSGQMWSLAPPDCVQARQAGYAVPMTLDPSPSPSPPPAPPADGTPAIVSAVEAAAAAVAAAVAGVAAEVASGVDRTIQAYRDFGNGYMEAVHQVGDAVTAVGTGISRAVTPDAGVMAGLVGEAKGALGAPLQGWTDALNGIAAAWSGSSSGCAGPSFPMPDGMGGTIVLHPLSACAEPFSSMAALVRIGAAVMLLTGGGWTCVRNLGSALGYTA